MDKTVQQVPQSSGFTTQFNQDIKTLWVLTQKPINNIISYYEARSKGYQTQLTEL